MTKEQLLNIPKRKWNESLENVRAVYIIPSEIIHDSGYLCMDFVAVLGENLDKYIRFGGCCDSVHIDKNIQVSFDCEPDNCCVRLWGDKPFTISHDLSTIFFK